MTTPISGHGVDLAVELDPVGAAGVFTTLGRLSGDFNANMTRAVTPAISHDLGIDVKVVSGVIEREQWDVSVFYIYGDTSHQGMKDHFLANTRFGIRARGPSSGAGAGVDELIASGQLSSWSEQNPVGPDGVRSAQAMFEPSDLMIIDGVTIGT